VGSCGGHWLAGRAGEFHVNADNGKLGGLQEQWRVVSGEHGVCDACGARQPSHCGTLLRVGTTRRSLLTPTSSRNFGNLRGAKCGKLQAVEECRN